MDAIVGCSMDEWCACVWILTEVQLGLPLVGSVAGEGGWQRRLQAGALLLLTGLMTGDADSPGSAGLALLPCSLPPSFLWFGEGGGGSELTSMVPIS